MLKLKLKLQYFGYLMWRANSLGKTLMLGTIEGRRRRGQQNMKWFNGITNSIVMNLSKLQEMMKDREAWMLQSMLLTLWTVASQVPLSMGFFQARILVWVAISSSRGSSNPTIKHVASAASALQADSWTTEPSGKPKVILNKLKIKICISVVQD